MSQVQQLGKQTMRAVKNYTKGYTDTQTMVREATSSDPWGPSGTQMNEISQLTYNQQDFIEVMEMIDKRLNDKGKNWRHVFKSLTLVDYLLHAGSENVVKYFKENLYIVKTLREFVYVDDEGKDQGANVRQKAKDITSLLMDPDRMAEARKGRASMRDRMAGNYSPPPMAPPPSSSSSTRPRSRTTGSRPTRNEDEDLQKAIEESKRLAEQQKSGEDDLQRAIRMSQEEDERRRAELAQNPNGGLFDPTQQQQQKPSDQLIDFDSNPNMMQPQPTGMMPQYTGMPNMHQFNSYNPFAAQQQAAQEEYMRMLEQQRQMEQQQQYQQMLQQQQYQQQQQQAQQQQFLMSQPTGMPMQPQHTAQPMMPQPTGFGSNNPFAAFSQPQQQQQDMSSSSLSPPQPQQQSPQQLQPERPASQPAANSSPSNAFPKRSNANDERHAELAAMLGGGGPGIDTYGNVGNMRVPIGSAFHPSNRMQAQATGVQSQATGNPFQRSASQPPQQQQQDQPFFSL